MANKKHRTIFCLSFARGCCGVGHECNYLHRIPIPGDEKHFTPLYDCFGRDKYMTDRYDMGGTGSFSRENCILYVGGISSMSEDIENTVRVHFSEWGKIESIKVLPRKYVAFVKYTSHLNAEYAKEAMFGQSFGNNEILNVRWSTVDPNPKVKAEIQREHEIAFTTAFLKDKTMEVLRTYEMYDREQEQKNALSEAIKKRKLEGPNNPLTLVASVYPNTNDQYPRQQLLYSEMKYNPINQEDGTKPFQAKPKDRDEERPHQEELSDQENPSLSLLNDYLSEEESSIGT
jgi:RNA recognition motif-containing protein